MIGYDLRKGYIYVISFSGYYKIGRSKHPVERVRQLLSVKFPIEPKLELSVEVPDAPFAEKTLHSVYHSKRVRGEWFNLTTEEIAGLSQTVASIDYSAALYTPPKADSKQKRKVISALDAARVIANGLDHYSYVSVRYLPSALRKLRHGRSIYVIGEKAVLRSIERKFGYRLHVAELTQKGTSNIHLRRFMVTKISSTGTRPYFWIG